MKEISHKESIIHNLIIERDSIKKNLLGILNLSTDLLKCKLIHEDKYINGIYADFTLVYDNLIVAA